MANWKNIEKLSSEQASKREAAFEAEMLAMLSKEKPSQDAPKSSNSPTPASAGADAIAISVTENGKTTTYSSLESVPLPLRQKITGAWLSKPTP